VGEEEGEEEGEGKREPAVGYNHGWCQDTIS